MPKSKNRRKKSKKYAKPISGVSRASSPKKSAQVKYKHKKAVGSEPKDSKQKKNLLQSLYANQAEGMYQLVSVLPFFFGAWLAGGIALKEILTFFIASLSLILGVYTPSLRKGEVPFRSELFMFIYLAQVALPLWFYAVTKSLAGLFLLAAACGLPALGGLLKLNTPSSVMLRAAQSVVSMTLLAILGVYTQSYSISSSIVPIFGVLGFVPGCLLASAYFAKYAEVFEKAGWRRSYAKAKKDGETVLRPASLARLYSLPFVLGPGLPVAVAPLGILPYSFLLCAAAFWKAPDLLEGFFQKSLTDVQVGVRTITLAAGMSIVVLLAGLFARL